MAASSYDSTSIRTMENLEHIRKNSSMYSGGSNTVYGNYICSKEIIDNSMDEASIDKNKLYRIDIVFFTNAKKNYYQYLVIDHGRGIPAGKLHDSFGRMFTSGKYEGNAYGATRGVWGVGAKLTTALANYMIAVSKRDTEFGCVEFVKSELLTKNISPKPLDKDKSTIGTTVFVEPDDSILVVTKDFMEHPEGYQKLVELVEFYSVFTPNVDVHVKLINHMLDVEDLKKMNAKDKWKYLQNIPFNGEGIEVYSTNREVTTRKYVQRKFDLRKSIFDLGSFVKVSNDDTDPLGYNIDLFIDENSLKGHNGLIAAVNMTPITNPTSTHIEMLQTVVKTYLEDYFEDKEQATYFTTKYNIPFSGYILAFWKNAQYSGQDKSRFENRKFGDYYRNCLRKELNKLPTSKWEVLYETIKENFMQEYAKYTKSAYKLTKNLKGIGYSLNRIGSFHNCVSTDKSITELFITEGDSAGGRVKAVRDSHFQAILKLSGKPFNAIKGDNKKLNANAIYQDMVRLIGVSPSDKNLDNMNFHRIIIMTDADDDGCHIVALLIGIFYRINPLILEQGRVLVTNPPLYSTLLKNQAVYLRDEDALEQSRITSVYKTLLDVYIETKQGETHLNDEQFMAFCYLVKRIGRITTTVANMLNVEPLVLEQLIHCVDYLEEGKVDTKQIKKTLGVDDVVWNQESNNIILIDEGLEFPIPLARLASEIRAYVLPEYVIGQWKHVNLYVTTKHSDLYVHQPCTYMMLYNIFEKLDTCYSIRRFKGLGEMSEAAIEYTCVDPKSRCYSTIYSIGQVKKIFDMLGVDTEARKKLIDEGYVEDK